MKNKKIINRISAILGVIVFLLIVFAIYNHIYPLSWGMHGNVNKGLISGDAINGYDPVAYFTEYKAVEGNENITYGYNDATWHFSTQENLDLFKNDPEKYSPQFGGYCSFAVSQGFSADSDPEIFEIIDGNLYLYAKSGVKEQWLKDGNSTTEKAEKNWK